MNKIKIILNLIFLFILFGFFQKDAGVFARCASKNGGCYSFDSCGATTSTCPGGGTCTYYGAPAGHATCNAPANDFSGVSSESCYYMQLSYGGGCTPEYTCENIFSSVTMGTYNNNSCDNSCNSSAYFNCVPKGTYRFVSSAHQMEVNGMCLGNCPSGYHSVSQGQEDCTVYCESCCNTTYCAKDVTTSNFYFCDPNSWSCGYGYLYATQAACSAAHPDGGGCQPFNSAGLAQCTQNCKSSLRTYYYCNNAGTCTSTSNYSDAASCAAGVGSACYVGSDCNGMCGGPMYYCDNNKNCQVTSANYTHDSTGQTNCQSNLTKYFSSLTNKTCYMDASSCSSACNPTNPIIPPPGGGGCTTWNCPPVSGQCGPAAYSSTPFSSSSAVISAGLCNSGVPYFTGLSGRQWQWQCMGTINPNASP